MPVGVVRFAARDLVGCVKRTAAAPGLSGVRCVRATLDAPDGRARRNAG